jgi:hypothetical protein
MATTYGTNAGKVINGTGTPAPGFVNGNVHSFVEVITLASQAAADITYVARIPKGAIFIAGRLTTTVSLGTTTISIGVVGSTAKYLAAATTLTAVDTPTLFGKAAATGVALTANDDVIITWATATAPASGSLVVVIEYAFD